MAADARTALTGNAARLVQDEQRCVLMEDEIANELLVRRLRDGLARNRLRRRRPDLRRDANRLTGLEPVARVGALAVETDLAGAEQPFERTMGELGEMTLEPAVEAQSGLVGSTRAPDETEAALSTGVSMQASLAFFSLAKKRAVHQRPPAPASQLPLCAYGLSAAFKPPRAQRSEGVRRTSGSRSSGAARCESTPIRSGLMPIRSRL